MTTTIERVRKYIRKESLMTPGTRVSAAVSGGADSVALLRLLLELREELGIVVSVCHFNHKIRGAEADADEDFVKGLAQRFGLELYSGAADVPTFAREHRISIETAARELRHAWFAEVIAGGRAERIATAHTRNDQAETVLMRILRGTGTRGLAGIAPWQKQKALIRPLLTTDRDELETYLNALNQPWREDASNQDLHHSRNRIRHELLPQLQHDYNSAIRETLADLAEIARAEEEYWEQELGRLMERLVRSGKPSRSGRSNDGPSTLALDVAAVQALPLAVQRRVLRAMGESLGTALEFKHIEDLLVFTREGKVSKGLSLTGGLEARRSHRELQLSYAAERSEPTEYRYSLPVPGEVEIGELGATFRARVVSLRGDEELSEYNTKLLNRRLLAPELIVRNWRPGDRFFPAYSRSPKKVKELLQHGRLGQEATPAQRKNWPVIESAGEIVWMRGFPPPEAFTVISGEAVLIEELTVV
jgi:tRNA(Ile)-lysidine synthase